MSSTPSDETLTEDEEDAILLEMLHESGALTAPVEPWPEFNAHN